MRYEREFITPEIAAELLGRNGSNRPKRPHHSRAMAQEMAGGRWRETHQGIAIDEHGALQDGQHRLEAITICGIGQWMWVARETPATNFNHIDVGLRRAVSDFIAIRGYKNARFVSALGCLAWQWEHGQANFPTGRVRDDQIHSMLERFPALCDLPQPSRRAFKIPPSQLAFMAYVSANDDFATDLCEGQPEDGPVKMLLATLIDRDEKGLKTNTRYRMALFVLARNDHEIEKSPVRRYMLRSTDGFPVVAWASPIGFGAAATPDEIEDAS